MNRVKYVPADKTARTLAPTSELTLTCTQERVELAGPLFRFLHKLRRHSVREADKMALRRGWVRLSELPPSERRRHIQAMRARPVSAG